MTEPRLTFEEHEERTRNTYRFFDDRIERDWRELGRSGTDVIHGDNLAREVTEQTAFAYGTVYRLRRMTGYLVAGFVFHLGFTHPILHIIGYLSYGCAALMLVWSLVHLRRETWLYVKKKDGTTILSFREKGLKGIDRARLIQEVQQYAEKHEKEA